MNRLAAGLGGTSSPGIPPGLRRDSGSGAAPSAPGHGLAPGSFRILLGLALLTLAGTAGAQEKEVMPTDRRSISRDVSSAMTPAPSATGAGAPCDPLDAPCYAAEGWLLTERSWTPGGAKPRDLVGGRLQAEIRWHRWRVAARGDATGIPGEYQQGQWETIRSAEAHVAVAWGPVCPPGAISIGPAAAFGAALTIEHDDKGNKAQLPKQVTAGLGLRASGPGWWWFAVVGQNQALRGVAATSVWQIAVSDRVANVGSLAIGAGGVYTGTFGVALRFK